MPNGTTIDCSGRLSRDPRFHTLNDGSERCTLFLLREFPPKPGHSPREEVYEVGTMDPALIRRIREQSLTMGSRISTRCSDIWPGKLAYSQSERRNFVWPERYRLSQLWVPGDDLPDDLLARPDHDNMVGTISGRLADAPQIQDFDDGMRCTLRIEVTQHRTGQNDQSFNRNVTYHVRTFDPEMRARIQADGLVKGDWVTATTNYRVAPAVPWLDKTLFDPRTGQRGQWKPGREKYHLFDYQLDRHAQPIRADGDGGPTDADFARELAAAGGRTN